MAVEFAVVTFSREVPIRAAAEVELVVWYASNSRCSVWLVQFVELTVTFICAFADCRTWQLRSR
jgi:hypothetical protein